VVGLARHRRAVSDLGSRFRAGGARRTGGASSERAGHEPLSPHRIAVDDGRRAGGAGVGVLLQRAARPGTAHRIGRLPPAPEVAMRLGGRAGRTPARRGYNARRPLVMASMNPAITAATRSGGSMNWMPERQST